MWVEVLLPLPGLAPRPPFDFMFLPLWADCDSMLMGEMCKLVPGLCGLHLCARPVDYCVMMAGVCDLLDYRVNEYF